MAPTSEEEPQVPPEDRREMLRTMCLIREFESRMQTCFADGEIPGFLHLYIGEEAIAAGVCQAIKEDDYIVSTHRGHGHCIARGLDTKRMAAELYGKADGYCNGKGGSMHIADVDSGMLGANGIVAAGVPIAAGAALSAQMRESNQIAVSFFGDGALSQGAFHEAMNLAGVWDLPLVGVVENNQYGEMSGLDDHHPDEVIDDLSVYGEPYGAVRAQVDGMDADEVYRTASEAVRRARDGGGPTLIECEAYRFEGHHEGDTEFYRTDEEKAKWRRQDPLRTYPQRLIDDGEITETERDQLKSEVESEIQAAIEYARESEYPREETAYEGLYAEDV